MAVEEPCNVRPSDLASIGFVGILDVASEPGHPLDGEVGVGSPWTWSSWTAPFAAQKVPHPAGIARRRVGSVSTGDLRLRSLSLLRLVDPATCSWMPRHQLISGAPH